MSGETVCDYTSVGVIARDDQGRILLIERNNDGWAPPSGHCNGASYGSAAFKLFEEGTGLKIVGAPRSLIPKNPRKNFKCRRGGEYHDWQIFEVNWKGELNPDKDEINNAKWHTIEEIRELDWKTRNYIGRMQALSNPSILAFAGNSAIKALEREWQVNSGLELVWCEFFKELKIIPGVS